LRIAAMNTRDSEQWRLLQLVPEIGVLWPLTASLTAPITADRAEPGSGELSRLLGFLDRPARERAVQGAQTVQALAGMNQAMRSTVLDEMSRDELEPVVERALMSGNREVADAVWRRWRQLAEPAGTPLPADVVEHLDAVAAQLRRRVETWQAERIEQAAARLRAFRPSEVSGVSGVSGAARDDRDPQAARHPARTGAQPHEPNTGEPDTATVTGGPRGRRHIRWPGPTGGGTDVGSCGAAVRPTQPGRPRPHRAR
jgi:hypothetical protein